MIDFQLISGGKIKLDIVQILMNNLEKFSLDVVDAVLKESTLNLRKEGSWVTGQLAKSGKTRWLPDEQTAEVVYDAPYAAAVEYGSRPHIAPLGPSLKVEKTKRGRLKLIQTPDLTINPFDFWAYRKGKREIIDCGKYGFHTSLGFGAWKKIMTSGADPHPFLRPAADQVHSYFGFYAKKYGFDIK